MEKEKPFLLLCSNVMFNITFTNYNPRNKFTTVILAPVHLTNLHEL